MVDIGTDFTDEQRAHLDQLYQEWVAAITDALATQSDNAQREDLEGLGYQIAFQTSIRGLLGVGAEPLSIVECAQQTVAEGGEKARH